MTSPWKTLVNSECGIQPPEDNEFKSVWARYISHLSLSELMLTSKSTNQEILWIVFMSPSTLAGYNTCE